MALNASIFGNMLNAPKSPEEYAAERENLAATRSTNMLNQAKVGEYQAGIKRQGELRNLLAGGADASGLRKGGFLDEAQKLQEQQTAAAEEARKAKTFDVDHAKRIMTLQGGLAKQVMANPSGQSAMAAIAEMERMSGQNMDAERQKIAMLQTPDQIRQWAAGHALTAEQLLPKLDTLNLGGSVQTRTVDPVTGRATVTGTDKVTMNPGQSAQLAQSERHFQQSRQDAMSKPFEVAGPDGMPALVQQDKAGNIRPVQGYGPKAAADKPLPEAAQKQVMGARNLQDAVGGYLSKLENWSNSKMLNPDQRAEMGNAYNNMMLQAKEAYNLGVLNGPDYDILQSVVKDPTKLTSILTSNEALSGQAKSLRNIAANIEKTALESHGKKYTPRNPSQTTTPKVGSIEDGHRFKGGDPSNPSNWEKVK